MICKRCNNFDNNKIIPKRFSKSGEDLCVPCYNLYQFQIGEPYVCSKCQMTQLRMKNSLECYSCCKLDEGKIIPKINYKTQSVYSQLNNEFNNKVYINNFTHLAEYYKLDQPDNCEVYMHDIPKEVIDFCQNSGFLNYDDVEKMLINLN